MTPKDGAKGLIEESFVLAGARIEEEDLGGILMAVLVDNADGILILNVAGEIVAANPAAEALVGRSVDDLIGTPLGEPLMSGVRSEIEILAPTGMRYAELLSRSTTWRGEPAKVVTIRDSTERRRAIDSLKNYVSMAAHEIGTPLTTVSGFAETLNTNWDNISDAERHRFVGIIQRHAARLSALSQDLLALSRLDAASMETHLEPVPLRASIVELLADGAAPDANFDVQIDDDVRVTADPVHLQTIIRNFVSNASKYGQPPFVVTSSLVADEDGRPMVEIGVMDGGEGVPFDFIPHLFESFARARRGIAREREGTGLGLALAHGLAELNEGTVGYRPNDPTGSVFTVTLPRT